MKKFLYLTIAALMALSCSKFDDSAIWKAINKNAEKIAELEQKCNNLNSDLESLKQIVSAIQSGDYILSCTPLSDGSGYTIVFKSGKSIVIRNGADGRDGATPQIGVEKFTDGKYYWTLNGEWLLDAEGNKIPTTVENGRDGKDGITPQLKIEDGYWYLSVDNGATWTKLGKATGADGKDGKDGSDGDSFFKSVTPGEDCIIFTLSDGTELRVPYYNGGSGTAVTGDYTDLNMVGVTLYGWCNQKESEGLSVLYGFEYSATDLTTAANTVQAYSKDADNKYSCRITNLRSNTLYYYRAYVYMGGVRWYGDVKTFTTTSLDPDICKMLSGDWSGTGFDSHGMDASLAFTVRILDEDSGEGKAIMEFYPDCNLIFEDLNINGGDMSGAIDIYGFYEDNTGKVHIYADQPFEAYNFPGRGPAFVGFGPEGMGNGDITFTVGDGDMVLDGRILIYLYNYDEEWDPGIPVTHFESLYYTDFLSGLELKKY